MSDVKLPEGWTTASIADISIKGEQRKPADAEQFVYVDIGSIDRNLKKISSPQRLTGKNAPSRARKVINSDDILVSLTRPNLNAVALVTNDFNNQIASTGFEVIKPNGVECTYIFNLVKSREFIDGISGKVQGALYPAAKSGDVRNYVFPLPPFAEQKEIAEQLDKLLAQVETIKKRIDAIPAILKRFRQSTLAAAISGKLTAKWRTENTQNYNTSILESEKNKLIKLKSIKADLTFKSTTPWFDIPATWMFLELKSIATKITDGEHKTPKRSTFGRYLLSARNIQNGYIDLGNVDYVDDEEFNKIRGRCNPDKDDILISCSGTVGRITLVDKSNNYVMVRSAALVKTLSKFIDNQYLMYVLRSPFLQEQIKEKSRSTAQSNLFLGQIKELGIPYPPLSEQHEIVRRVEELFAFADKAEDRVKEAQAHINNLTQSILAKAFKGELTAAWRAANPELITGKNSAAALLARIKSERKKLPPSKKKKRKSK